MWLTGGTYQSWAEFLERWAKGDDTGFDRLPKVDPGELNAETLVRLADRLVTVMAARLQDWADRLTRAMAAESGEFGVARALTQARTGLRSVRRLAAHPGLPEDLRARLGEMVDRQIASSQDQLEADLTRMAAGGVSLRQIDARRRTVRENRLTAVLAEPAATGPEPARSNDSAGSAGRQIIINGPAERVDDAQPR
jgi:hypothetical protein